jgi:hypothetical protein
LHAVPAAAFAYEHTPVDVLHTPACWHWSGDAHVTGFTPVHTPAWHVSVCVHALVSLHAVPLVLIGFEHTPVAGLQVPTE